MNCRWPRLIMKPGPKIPTGAWRHLADPRKPLQVTTGSDYLNSAFRLADLKELSPARRSLSNQRLLSYRFSSRSNCFIKHFIRVYINKPPWSLQASNAQHLKGTETSHPLSSRYWVPSNAEVAILLEASIHQGLGQQINEKYIDFPTPDEALRTHSILERTNYVAGPEWKWCKT